MNRHRPLVRLLLAVVLLPAALGALALWSLSERVDDLDQAPAAVVNLDRPVQSGEGGQQQTIAAGRLLAAGLTAPDDPDQQVLGWELTDARDAEAGLADGSYHAVLTIPRDFSETLAGLAENRPRQAGITVRTGDVSGAVLGSLTDQVGAVAAAELGQQITSTYLEGLYGETSRLAVRLGRAADGADRLAGGATDLSDGATRLGAGARELAAGLGTLAGGADQLREGSSVVDGGVGRLAGGLGQLSSGAGDLSVGAERLGDGVARLGSGTTELATGADDLADGADDLATGLGRLREQLRPMPEQTDRLADGAGQVSDGVGGWARVLQGWQQACAGDPLLVRYAALCAGTEQAVGADGGTADRLVAGSTAVAEGTRELADASPALLTGVTDAAEGAGRLGTGARRLADGAERLAGGAQRLAAGAGTLSGGAGDLADGATSASAGVTELAGGTARLEQGAGELSAGVHEARGGAAELAAGAGRLAEGAGELESGSGELADRLRQGVDQVPSQTEEEQRQAAQAAAQPVTSRTERAEASAADTVAPAVLALALWIGALVLFLVRPALPPERLAEAGLPLRVALAGWRPAALLGALQGLLLLSVLGPLDVGVAHLAGLVGVLLVSVLSFAAVNQALVAALGARRGWVASIGFTLVQTLTLSGLVPIDSAPAVLRALHGVLPVPVAADLVRWALLDTGAGLAGGVLLLLAWGGAGLVLSVRAARRAARLSIDDVRAAAGEDVDRELAMTH
ncbi:YhgE/Pip family protein [Nocardioides ferulae]|uniref:YhgE/Pip family protein n=1 Tax=Nocardioides ferulae TaxID=2340821 RepID=UPI0013DDE798|nr:YhgE/Pip family protein [Nocardioides ferulae]